MDPVIAKFSEIYTEDLSERLGLNESTLPNAVSFPTLLNPMFGNKKLIVDSGLMTDTQYERAKGRLIQRIVSIKDKENPVAYKDVSVENEVDSEDDGVVYKTNDNYSTAIDEWQKFETYKVKKYRPSVAEKTAKALGDTRKILVGPLDGRGEDLPSGKNLADYVDKRGRINLLRFYEDHSSKFKSLWVLAQCEESNQVVEVGCERFFSLSGCVSSEKRTRLKVRTYERLAMLAAMIKKVYIDYEWVAQEYMRRSKEKLWDVNITTDALKCFNLERILEAELYGMIMPKEMTLEELCKGEREV